MIQMQNCQQMTASLKKIRQLKIDLQNTIEIKNPQVALEIKIKLEKLIQEAYPILDIEGRKFPVTFLTTNGKTGTELETELKDGKINISDEVSSMIKGSQFVKNLAGEIIMTVRLKVNDLFSDGQWDTYDQILDRAANFSLTELPHETGPDLILKEETQPKMEETIRVAMKPIMTLKGDPVGFSLSHNNKGLTLTYVFADLYGKWNPDFEFIFRLNLSTPTKK